MCKVVKYSLITLFVIAVVASSLLYVYKYYSLDFHKVDYSFYIQFNARLFNGDLSKQYSISPYGINFMYFHGFDGGDHFHKTIHMEPVKYLFALLFNVTNNPFLIFLVIALLYFSPLLYLAFTYPVHTKREAVFISLFSFLYVIYPSVIYHVSYDLRPFTLLIPFFSLTFISLVRRRHLIESLLFFNLIFLAREEGLIMGFILLAFALIYNEDSHKKTRLVVSLTISWFFWFIAFFAFVIWTGYRSMVVPLNIFIDHPYLLVLPVLSFITGIYYINKFANRIIHHHPRYRNVLAAIAYSLFFLPLAWQIINKRFDVIATAPMTAIRNILYDLVLAPRFTIYFISVLLLLFYAWHVMPRGKQKRFISGIFAFFVLFSMVVGPFKLRQRVDLNELQANRLLFDFKRQANNVNTHILTDYKTNLVFYDFEHNYAYNRLPSNMIEPDNRFYPENLSMLSDLIKNQIEYIIVTKTNMNDINHILDEAAVAPAITVFENNEYIVLKLRDKTDDFLGKNAVSH